jgi:hypothetical protein
LVTCGQAPDWLNSEHPKLSQVKHEDYIPKKYLPTFSANPIELNLHRIPELSEQFIFFNDDMFITNQLEEHMFFQNNMPCDIAVQDRISSNNYADPFAHIVLNDTAVINAHFNKKKVLRDNWQKWLHPSYGIANIVRSLTFLPYSSFTGFLQPHLPAPYLKKTFETVWNAEPAILDSVCMNKFRDTADLNQYVMREWQLLSGNFSPYNPLKHGHYFDINQSNINKIAVAIENQSYNILCLNDTAKEDIEPLKKSINQSLNRLLPNKSFYEL